MASCCLGQPAIDAVNESADAIRTIFIMKHFTDDEMSSLIMNRVVPPSFRGGAEDAAELLDLIDGLWGGAEKCYQSALNRPPNQIERQQLYALALDVLRSTKP